LVSFKDIPESENSESERNWFVGRVWSICHFGMLINSIFAFNLMCYANAVVYFLYHQAPLLVGGQI